MKSSEVSCGLAHELVITLAKAGWEIPDIDTLAKNEGLCREILPFLRGDATIREHIIDCSIKPFCPDGWKVLPPEEQIPTRFQGSLKWSQLVQKEMFYLSEKQTKGKKLIKGDELRKELVDMKILVLPANILDYLLANPNLIPKEWKSKAIFFWGTIYRRSGNLYVRYLFWDGSLWGWSDGWLGGSFGSDDPVGVPASQN